MGGGETQIRQMCYSSDKFREHEHQLEHETMGNRNPGEGEEFRREREKEGKGKEKERKKKGSERGKRSRSFDVVDSLIGSFPGLICMEIRNPIHS